MAPLLFIALASAIAGARGFTTSSGSIENCGDGTALFTITKLGFSPDVLAPGENATLTLFYTSPEEITGGTAKTSISYNFIPFEPTVEDLCTKVECPLSAGDHDGSTTMQVPSGLSGYIDSKVEWFDTAGRLLLCIDSTFTISAMKVVSKRWNSLRNAVGAYFG